MSQCRTGSTPRCEILYIPALTREIGMSQCIAKFEEVYKHLKVLVHYRGGVVVRLLASHLCEPGSILGRVPPGFSHVGIVPDDAAGRWVFSGISRFLRPYIPALLHIHFASPASALKTSLLRAAQISSLTCLPSSVLAVFATPIPEPCRRLLHQHGIGRTESLQVISSNGQIEKESAAEVENLSVASRRGWCGPAGAVTPPTDGRRDVGVTRKCPDGTVLLGAAADGAPSPADTNLRTQTGVRQWARISVMCPRCLHAAIILGSQTCSFVTGKEILILRLQMPLRTTEQLPTARQMLRSSATNVKQQTSAKSHRATYVVITEGCHNESVETSFKQQACCTEADNIETQIWTSTSINVRLYTVPCMLMDIKYTLRCRPTSRGGWCATDLGMREALGSNPGVLRNPLSSSAAILTPMDVERRGRSSDEMCLMTGEAGVSQDNPPANGNVRHVSHIQQSGFYIAETSSVTTPSLRIPLIFKIF
ncbi:hypothetical protein PR048_025300 [Dryococelus australis]|uniref:Uncharacterized protein n=1 Tax=Dryococelus australis TaxID=614101 RepID=A0ABQ9GR04_9NEOP|nr:hypothetical protein PR048_025300 [Dryococelus australis]